MRTTIKEAENNTRGLTIEFSGYGHYKITADIRGKRKHCITTNSMAVDDFKSEFGEIDEATREMDLTSIGRTDLKLSLKELLLRRF